MKNELDNGHLYSRLHKTSCCPDKISACNCLFHGCRKLVSGKKMRFEQDSFDLDLTYLSDRIIVHGFPAIGIEHIYRNPRYEIKRFLDARHNDHYKMYNFCCEPGRGYDAAVFNGRVERYPFKDHNTPPLETMIEFGESAKSWLDADAANVCSMHCKAGKGRAGLMSCILLLRSGTCASAVEALEHYDNTRVSNKRGLTVVSQRKYVIFYEELWRNHWGVKGDIGKVPGKALPLEGRWAVPEQPEFRLFGIEILYCNIPLRRCRVTVYKGTYLKPALVWDSGRPPHHSTSTITTSTEYRQQFDCDTAIQGNFKIHVEFKESFFSTKPTTLFELWHNTLFIERCVKKKEGREKRGTYLCPHLTLPPFLNFVVPPTLQKPAQRRLYAGPARHQAQDEDAHRQQGAREAALREGAVLFRCRYGEKLRDAVAHRQPGLN